MTKTLEAARALISARVYGPFREAGGLPGERSAMRLDAAARAYLWNRKRRYLPAARALAEAAPVALRAHDNRGSARLWYGGTAGAGPMDSDGLRWIEKTDACGLRFIGDACDILSSRSIPTGYYTDAEGDYSTLRAGVWALPGSGGRVRMVAGYREFDGRTETNPGSARIDCRELLSALASDSDVADELAKEAAHAADGIAESVAERERDYNEQYAAGRAAAALDGEAIDARRELLPLLAELRAMRRAGSMGTPAICAALRSRVDSLLETISGKRDERESAWGRVTWAADVEAWAAGFTDEAGFVRAVRLGYRKATDWRGKPEANPCAA